MAIIFLIIKAASAVNVLSEYHKLWYVLCVCSCVVFIKLLGGGGCFSDFHIIYAIFYLS